MKYFEVTAVIYLISYIFEDFVFFNLFSHVVVSKWLRKATINEIGPVLSESVAASRSETRL